MNFVGKLPANVYSKDLILTLINKIGVKGATNAVLEFGGPVIDEMSVEGRMTITNMAVEAGATSGMMMVDAKTINYLHLATIKESRKNPDADRDFEGLMRHNSDPDATYDQTIEIDVSEMVPVITENYSPGEITTVQKLAGKPVNQIYIGSVYKRTAGRSAHRSWHFPLDAKQGGGECSLHRGSGNSVHLRDGSARRAHRDIR